jgi:P4 family phage/plasmid primase-like protien
MSQKTAEQNRTDAILSNLAEYSNYQYAELYYKHNTDKYLYSKLTGWYSYNEYNILENHNKEPIGLINDISLFLQNYIKTEMNTLKMDDMADYGKKHKELLKAFKLISSSTIIKSIVAFLPQFYLIKDLDDKIDADQNFFCFSNKVYDIRKGKFKTIKKEYYLSRNTGYDAPENITQEQYKEIDDLFFSIFENKKVADYLLFITAMSLYTNRFEKLYILTGNGRNGKGLITTLINKAFGTYFLMGSNDLLTCKDEQKNPTLAKAKGIRYMAISEPAEENDKETKFNLSMVKKLTGRDILSVRTLYKEPIEYVPSFTMFISCNKQPAVDETNEAIRNRFRFIHFPFTFVNKPKRKFERPINIELKDQIEKNTELRDIFINYILYLVSQDYDKQHIIEPEECIVFTNKYFDDNDDVGGFLEKYFIITEDENDRIKAKDLYELYNDDGDFKKISNVKFSECIKSNNIEKQKKFCMEYVGLKRKPFLQEKETDDKPYKNPLDLD